MTKYDKLIGTDVAFYHSYGVVKDIIDGHKKTYVVIHKDSSNFDAYHQHNMLVPIDAINSVYQDADGNAVHKSVEQFLKED